MNVAEPPVEMLNVFQLMMARSVVWLTMTELVPAPVTVAVPPTTLGPVGCAPPGPAPSVAQRQQRRGGHEQIAEARRHRFVPQ